MSTYRFAAIAALACAAAAPVARGDDADATNRVSFAVERTREVENDLGIAIVGVTKEDSDPARLADQINTDVSWGLEAAKGEAGVTVRSGGYRTYPMDDPKRAQIRRWRGSQDLVLEARDPRLLSELLGQLQQRLQIRSLDFGVSPQRRRSVEDELVDEALDAFRARAERISRKLGAGQWELVHVRVNTSGSSPHPMQRMAMAEPAVRPPALEAGTSTLTVRADATIELRF